MNSTLNPNYIVGFVDGEGCFSITINKNNERLPEVRLLFEIELEESDEGILKKIARAIGCGKIYKISYRKRPNWNSHSKLKVGNFEDINEKVIQKRFQFEKFYTVAEMMKAKQHLTAEGIERIRRIRNSV